jgi:predicted MPP superfamily phosphohydrolase
MEFQTPNETCLHCHMPIDDCQCDELYASGHTHGCQCELCAGFDEAGE